MMSYSGKRELLGQVVPRYQEADFRQKGAILDEFVASTGYARKYAIRLLTLPVTSVGTPICRPRAPRYGPEVQAALLVAWSAANFLCSKRLVPFLPELLTALETHGHLSLAEEVRAGLIAISPATVDRLLQPHRPENGGRGVSTTKRGLLVKHQVPIRTFADWNDARPGFMEADLVAHCGARNEGSYLNTLVLTDIATGWTECLPLLFRSQHSVIEQITRVRQLLPFPLLGLDTDNGSEFLNHELIEYCRQEEITFTRSRAYRKNDQCFVEQKNGVIVRQLVGYDRYEGMEAYQQLMELYRATRLYVNFFQPSMKLVAKERQGARVQRKYDAAQTPFQRLRASPVLAAAAQAQLQSFYHALDPIRLLRQVEALQDALWRHAWRGESEVIGSSTGAPALVRFRQPTSGAAGKAAAGGPAGDAPPATVGKRAYRRSGKPRGPHTWRTRPDPYAAGWGEVSGWLAAAPERTAKSLLEELQARHPGQYGAGQLRTLQRRVKAWREQVILTFDDGWLAEDLSAGAILPGPLRARAAPGISGGAE